MAVWARSTVWVDANGFRSITKLTSVGGASSVVGDLQALSNADTSQYWESAVTTNVPVPVSAPYQSGGQRAALTFICADTTNVVVIVPAPKLTIFQADGITVDLLNVDVILFATAAVAQPLCNPSGSPVTALLSGTLLPGAASPL